MLMIGWTTVETHEQAEMLARDLVESRLVACVQIDGPITSFFLWNGVLEKSAEYRLTAKFLSTHEKNIEARVLSSHPYETPEWITARAENVSEKYLSWVKSGSSN